MAKKEVEILREQKNKISLRKCTKSIGRIIIDYAHPFVYEKRGIMLTPTANNNNKS